MKKIALAIVLASTIASCKNAADENKEQTHTKAETPVPPSKQTDLQSEYLSGNVQSRISYSSQPATLNDKNEWVTSKEDDNIYDINIYSAEGYLEQGYKIANGDTLTRYEHYRDNNSKHTRVYRIEKTNEERKEKTIGSVHHKFTGDYTISTDVYMMSGNDSVMVEQSITEHKIISPSETKYLRTIKTLTDGKPSGEVTQETTEIKTGDTILTTSPSAKTKIIHLQKDNKGNVTRMVMITNNNEGKQSGTIFRFKYEYYDK